MSTAWGEKRSPAKPTSQRAAFEQEELVAILNKVRTAANSQIVDFASVGICSALCLDWFKQILKKNSRDDPKLLTPGDRMQRYLDPSGKAGLKVAENYKKMEDFGDWIGGQLASKGASADLAEKAAREQKLNHGARLFDLPLDQFTTVANQTSVTDFIPAQKEIDKHLSDFPFIILRVQYLPHICLRGKWIPSQQGHMHPHAVAFHRGYRGNQIFDPMYGEYSSGPKTDFGSIYFSWVADALIQKQIFDGKPYEINFRFGSYLLLGAKGPNLDRRSPIQIGGHRPVHQHGAKLR